MEKPGRSKCEQRTSEKRNLEEQSDYPGEESSEVFVIHNLSIKNYFDSSIRAYEKTDFLQEKVEAIVKIPGVIKNAIILIVGDSGTGKSLLASTFTLFLRNEVSHYTKTVVNLSDTMKKPGCYLGLHILCAPFRRGDDNCFLRDPLRKPPYDLVIFIFDVNVRKTLDSILEKWHPEVSRYLFRHRTPTLLVGNKIDRTVQQGIYSESETDDAVYYHEGDECANRIRAHRYVEVSAMIDDNTEFLMKVVLDLIC